MKDPASPNAGISGHFRREAKWMLWVLVVLPLALTALAVWLGPLVLNHVERSQCLDAGMQASQEKRKCEQR
ncbi:hypothetical protein HMPREF9701_01934 [Delftia acidovorans CCUG 274B]|uniref:hypothetical protein n=1 Tax=Delftia TaxID=80865 RepID=UPI00035455C0|nr:MULTISPECIES: hypothetical protein [Delftia]EPD41380.1 hypothetical protein HMPREF9701_01934 [Delftia acidovorans CCUG 274B]MCX7505999.1 hypothetical protein [Delftia tsuruhatensis]PZP75642.1 MAG: hypothetical protein DI604_04020 [Delftia acidovorans]